VATSPGPPELGWALVAATDLPSAERASLVAIMAPVKLSLRPSVATWPLLLEKPWFEPICTPEEEPAGTNSALPEATRALTSPPASVFKVNRVPEVGSLPSPH